MKTLVRVLVYLSALATFVPFLKPKEHAATILLWPWKLLSGALSYLLSFYTALGAVIGFFWRDWPLVGVGALGAALSSRFRRSMPDPDDEFTIAFGPGWRQQVPEPLAGPGSCVRPLAPSGQATWERNHIYGREAATGIPLLADLWLPPQGTPSSGLGVVYIHGGGWRVGFKDMGTRPFFKSLASQGHAVLDIAYTLWPEAILPQMVAEVKQAVVWLKQHGSSVGVDPDRIVLMGGSAGAHLALMGAYTRDIAEFEPTESYSIPPWPDVDVSKPIDTTVAGVVAYYPPVDFLGLRAELESIYEHARTSDARGLLARISEAMLSRLFALSGQDLGHRIQFRDFLPTLVGGETDAIPERFQHLSPVNHVGRHCPPTLLLQGTDDVFLLAPGVRRMHEDLRRACVPAVLVEFPHTEHAFDLVLPRISPQAQIATRSVERFLALLARGPSPIGSS
jgi:acetyl esterase/lipase